MVSLLIVKYMKNGDILKLVKGNRNLQVKIYYCKSISKVVNKSISRLELI